MSSLVFLVHTADPSQADAATTGSKTKNIIRATAAKQVHARRRRARTAQYQADKAATERHELQSRLEAVCQAQDAAVCRNQDPELLLAPARADPFDSFALKLNRQDKFLFDHYITALIPHWVARLFPPLQQAHNCLDSQMRSALYNDMVRLAVTDAGLLMTTMLAACRHLSRHAGVRPLPLVKVVPSEYYMTLAMEYKVKCVKTVIDDIARRSKISSAERAEDCEDPTVQSLQSQQKQVEADNITLSKIMVLVLDEIWLGDILTARLHVLGAMKMICLNGGPSALQKNGFVAHMLEIFLSNKLLAIDTDYDTWISTSQDYHTSRTAGGSRDKCVNPCDTMAWHFFSNENQRVIPIRAECSRESTAKR